MRYAASTLGVRAGNWAGVVRWMTFACALLALAGVEAAQRSIPVPNHSFESPATLFVNVQVDGWQKGPKPDWYAEEGGEYQWNQLVGVFRNPPPGAFDHLENCEGAQAIWVFAVPEVELFQDYESVDWNDPAPTHGFDATYQAGQSYELIVGVLGAGGGMRDGVPLELSLYYRDPDGHKRTVAATVITNSAELFPTRNRFWDFSVSVAAVRAEDAWAGRKIGIRIRSTVSLEEQGGYWDVDNIRLIEVGEEPLTLSSTLVGSDLRVGWMSKLGLQYQVEVSENLLTWTAHEPPTAGTGGELFSLVSVEGAPPAFVRVQAIPAP